MTRLRFLAALALACVTLTTGAEARQRHRIVQPICDNRDVMRPCAYQPNFMAGVRSIRVQMRRERAPRAVSRAVEPGHGIVRSASGATARVAPSASGAFQCLVTALDNAGYPVRFMGGWRARGSVRGSLHPAGLALDINQVARNVTTPRMPGNEIALANSCGLISGRQWAHGDSGHFQLGGWAGTGRHYASRHHRHRYASAR